MAKLTIKAIGRMGGKALFKKRGAQWFRMLGFKSARARKRAARGA